MSENNFENNPKVEEVSQQETVETRALDDSTHDPSARIEQTQTFASAETIEQALVASVEQNEAQQVSGEKIQAPDKVFRDPLTGKGSDGKQESSKENSPETAAEAQSEDSEVDKQPAGKAEHNPSAGSHEPETATHDVGDGTLSPQDIDQGAKTDIDIQGIDSNGSLEPDQGKLLPEKDLLEKQLPIGYGQNGAIFPESGNSTNWGDYTGRGYPSGGGLKGHKGSGGSSGGGLPVNHPGGRSSSNKNGSQREEGDHFHSGDTPLGRWLFMKASENETNYVEEPDGTGFWMMDKNGDWWWQYYDPEPAPAELPPQGDPIDGEFPMPYTGSGGGGEDPDPDIPIGGLDRETGRVSPILEGTGTGEGGRTPGDKDGEDDSGHFLSDPNLVGSDDYVPPPDDDIPYNKLNTLKDK